MMTAHIVASFDDELAKIDLLITDMGDLAQTMLADATRALVEADLPLAQRVISDDVVMDARQREIDERCVALIAKRQPMAQDLRAVIGSIRIASDLERIGDLSKNIAKRVGAVGAGPMQRRFSHSLSGMTGMVGDQLEGVVRSHVTKDVDALVTLRADDKRIDIQYTAVFRELLTYMMEDPRNITACTHLLFCAKNLERIGDHATNIAENAFYMTTGRQLPADRPKTDETTHTGS